MKAASFHGSLVFLHLAENAIGAVNTDGSGYRRLLTHECVCPDGLALDLSKFHQTKKLEDVCLLWTNMGAPKPDPKEKDGGDWHSPDGFLATATLLGGDASAKKLPLRAPENVFNTKGERVAPRFPSADAFFTTLKQLTISHDGRSIFACDREGHCVKKYNRDTHEVVPLLFSDDIPRLMGESNKACTPGTDEDKMFFCVGISLDELHNQIYFTLKGPTHGGRGRILAAPYNFATRNVPTMAGIPDGAEGIVDASAIVPLMENLPEPIDLLLDSKGGYLYWTDRGAEELGGCSLNRAPLTFTAGVPQLGKLEILITGFGDAIGVTWAAEEEPASDVARRYMYVTDIAGHVYRCDLNEKTKTCIYKGTKGITGIDYIPESLPA